MYKSKKGAIGQTMTLIVGTVIIFFILLIFYFIVGELAVQRRITTNSRGVVALIDFQKGDFDFAILCMAHSFQLFFGDEIFYKDKLERINEVLDKLGHDYKGSINQNKFYIVKK